MGDTITVSREWFDRVMQLWNWERLGCPLCGDTEKQLIVDRTQGFSTRYGCAACDRWFNKPECSEGSNQ